MGVLRIWFLVTAALLGGGLIWAVVPILVPILGLTVGIGCLVAGIVVLARWLEHRRNNSRS